ncbi:MAG: TatD family hydrolase [Clostridia bacterium]|nr:TatD family hydrolase [Clostridia bacterium]
MKEETKVWSAEGLIDSHAHYFDSRFGGEGDHSADEILSREVFGAGIAAAVNVATNPENALACIRQAQVYSGLYAAVGIHPEDCKALGDADEEIERIRVLADTPEKRKKNKIIAIGEIGLDYYWEPYDKARQAEFFEKQMLLAKELGLPVIIHDREAHGDCFETVLRHPDVTGVFHSFSGSAEMARELCRRGWYISFSGVLTFRNARKVREVAQVVPSDRILVETDCPYLSPEPFRGRLNHSGRMVFTAAALAEARGTDYQTVVSQTSENACVLFGLPDKV